MRKVLHQEIGRERCNQAALGLFNSSVASGEKSSFNIKEDKIEDAEKFRKNLLVDIRETSKYINETKVYLKDNRESLSKDEIKFLENGVKDSIDYRKNLHSQLGRFNKSLRKSINNP